MLNKNCALSFYLFIPCLIFLFENRPAFCALDLTDPSESLIQVSSRVKVSVELNEKLDSGFLEQVEPFKDYLYRVQQVDLEKLNEELVLLEWQIYQSRMKTAHYLVLRDFNLKNKTELESQVSALASTDSKWDLEGEFKKLGVRIVNSGTQIEKQPHEQIQAHLEEGKPLSPPTQLAPPVPAAEVRAYIRAFDLEQTHLENVKTEMISLEKLRQEVRGWQQATQEESQLKDENGAVVAQEHYWPTLSWVDPLEHPIQPVPLMTHNSIRVLESKFGSTLNKGIVFGKLAAGWVVKYPEESSIRPLFLNEKFEPMAVDMSDAPRYFIFVGATPGSGMVQVISTQYPWSGSLRFPVLEKTATYLDLSSIAVKTITGRVLDREIEHSSGVPLPSVVRVAGQSSPMANTDDHGEFRLNNVLVLSHYPIFIDAEKAGQSTLRYRVLPEKLKSLALYRVKEGEIDAWRSQLRLFKLDINTGIFELDREKPMVVGYFRNPIGRNSNLDLLPHFELIPHNSKLNPIPYVRSPGGLLEEDVYLSVHDSRVISANIPNSSFIMGIKKEGSEAVYTEWGYSSSSVVNVLGPD